MKNFVRVFSLIIVVISFIYACQDQDDALTNQSPKHSNSTSSIKSNIQYEEISFAQFKDKEAPSVLNALDSI